LLRSREIEAAIAAYSAANPDMLLPPQAARRRADMFGWSSVCQRSLADLAAGASDTLIAVDRLLRFLTATGFLTKEQSPGWVPNVYRLNLPPDDALSGNLAVLRLAQGRQRGLELPGVRRSVRDGFCSKVGNSERPQSALLLTLILRWNVRLGGHR
jgi:hypothetical protein